MESANKKCWDLQQHGCQNANCHDSLKLLHNLCKVLESKVIGGSVSNISADPVREWVSPQCTIYELCSERKPLPEQYSEIFYHCLYLELSRVE